jgi:hypothetical protein
MKTSIIYSLFLLGSNSSLVGAQNAAPKVLRGSSPVFKAQELIEEGNCTFYGYKCSSDLQCCSGRCRGRCTSPYKEEGIHDAKMIAEGNVQEETNEFKEKEVLRGSSPVVVFEYFAKEEAQEKIEDDNKVEESDELIEEQCFGTGQICHDNSQCCSGLVCSGSTCRPDCPGRGALCFSDSQCCSRNCAGFLCR